MAEFENDVAGVTEVFLQPGGFYFGDKNTTLRTLLGSCVAMTLWHPERRIGGMCHYMLPSRGDRRDAVLNGRYANEAMELFLRELRRTGTSLQEYEAKLFGGSNLSLDNASSPACDGTALECRSVACRNVVAGMDLVDRYGLRLKARHLGGATGCEVTFDIGNGNVRLKMLGSLAWPPDVAEAGQVRRQTGPT